MSAIDTHSSILWIVALIGPNSIVSPQMVEMKRPSDVPPVVDRDGVTPQCRSIAAVNAAESAPAGERNGRPPTVHAIEWRMPSEASVDSTRAFNPSAVDSVENRKLKSATA